MLEIFIVVKLDHDLIEINLIESVWTSYTQAQEAIKYYAKEAHIDIHWYNIIVRKINTLKNEIE